MVKNVIASAAAAAAAERAKRCDSRRISLSSSTPILSGASPPLDDWSLSMDPNGFSKSSDPSSDIGTTCKFVTLCHVPLAAHSSSGASSFIQSCSASGSSSSSSAPSSPASSVSINANLCCNPIQRSCDADNKWIPKRGYEVNWQRLTDARPPVPPPPPLPPAAISSRSSSQQTGKANPAKNRSEDWMATNFKPNYKCGPEGKNGSTAPSSSWLLVPTSPPNLPTHGYNGDGDDEHDDDERKAIKGSSFDATQLQCLNNTPGRTQSAASGGQRSATILRSGLRNNGSHHWLFSPSAQMDCELKCCDAEMSQKNCTSQGLQSLSSSKIPLKSSSSTTSTAPGVIHPYTVHEPTTNCHSHKADEDHNHNHNYNHHHHHPSQQFNESMFMLPSEGKK